MTNYDILKEYEAHKTPVPSYEEYISLINWKEDLTELCTVKERIIEKYENIDTWWKAECTELKEQNAQLKELLKEWVQFEIEENQNDFTVMSERMSELANKTKEALK